nr:L,D-transpeptidase [Actinomycetes bacterium]
MRRASCRQVGAMIAAGLAVVVLLTATSAAAEPMTPAPPGSGDPFPLPPVVLPDDFAPPPFSPFPGAATQSTPAGVPAGQNPMPYLGEPVFAPPTFNPVNRSMVGVARPIVINFQRKIVDRPLAEQAVHISSDPPVPGKYYWMTDTQLRWRPIDFWPANTTVSIDAGGTKSSFRTGDSLVATIDDSTHQMEIMRNGTLERTIPVSLGKPGYETPNGTYYVLEKFADMVMDSSTYGVPVDSVEGYKLKVQDAVRINNAGIFVHGAPWSVADQGKRNVSHGCPNLSPADAQWFY